MIGRALALAFPAAAAMWLAAAAPAGAQEPEWLTAREHDIRLSPYAYEPDPIRLEAGEPVRLRFINQARATLSFSASRFFEAARIRRGDEARVPGGKIRLAPGEQQVVALVPAPGTYRARSGNLIHRLRGMSVRIIVE